ncbi:serine hydrolase domain-containing protein [Microbacterium sp. 22242]|uniref:serine hydrolase domain-containing protein n=1 Tax=Microbacterium sp. 22242 TaxID=3453896 RepID=UPI003F841FBB
MRHTLPTAPPEQHGLDPESAHRTIAELERAGLDPHALVIARHGHVLSRTAWEPWSADGAALVYSVSKTFTAIAIGLLEADGRIDLHAGVDRYLALPNPHGITVAHLLTMNTGHSRTQTLTLPFDVRALLTIAPEHTPGTHFAYNSPATFALSAIVTAVSGLSLTALLQDRLFTPLGIGPRWWARHEGLDQGFSGLHLTVDDLARIGIALADGGRFQGRQVIPAAFVHEATRAWSDTREPDQDPDGDWALGYGYQLWRSRHGFRLDGAYGQFALVIPERGIVIAYQGATDRTQETLSTLWRLVESFADVPVTAEHRDPEPHEHERDSWEARALLLPAPEAVPDATDWSLEDAGDGGWELGIPGSDRLVRVEQGRWRRDVLPLGDGVLSIAVRGERSTEGEALVHVVIPTSPHRMILRRDSAGLHPAWHTTPLWHPTVGTLVVPDEVARPAAPPRGSV